MAVLPELQGQGIGRQLLNAVKNYSKPIRDKFNNFRFNYYIGKAIEFCRENNLDYKFVKQKILTQKKYSKT